MSSRNQYEVDNMFDYLTSLQCLYGLDCWADNQCQLRGNVRSTILRIYAD